MVPLNLSYLHCLQNSLNVSFIYIINEINDTPKFCLMVLQSNRYPPTSYYFVVFLGDFRRFVCPYVRPNLVQDKLFKYIYLIE